VTDQGNGIAVDSAGNAYVTGNTVSSDFPTTPGAFQTTCCGAFVTKFNATGSALVYSTYLDDGNARGIAVDSAGNAYVTGSAGSSFPVTPGTFQAVYGGGGDAFVAKLNSTGSALVYSTYLGGSGFDQAQGIAVDSAGNAYVTGETGSTDFPTINPLQPALGGSLDAFVTKINPASSALVYSTYLGGSSGEFGYAIAVDSAGNAYVTGDTGSKDFPVTLFASQKGCEEIRFHPECDDAFVTKINFMGQTLLYSTFLGGGQPDTGYGIAVDGAGNAYVTGLTYSRNFHVTPGAFQTLCANYYNCYRTGDAFVVKFQITAAVTKTMISSSPNPSSYGQAVTFTAAVTTGDGGPPDGETVSFMKGTQVLGTAALSLGMASFTTSTLKVGGNLIKAAYGGDSNFLGSTSLPVKQVVNKAGE
jgi:hypothetical protein